MRTTIAVLAMLATFCGSPLFAQEAGGKEPARETPPAPVTLKSPSYPGKALEARIEGVVYVSALIDESGRVVKTKIERSTSTVFDSAAVAAVKGSTFTPARKDGKPVEAWVTLPYKFKLSEKQGK